MEYNISQGTSQQMSWQRMRGANRGVEADYLTVGNQKVYLAVYPPRVWGDDWSVYVFIDGKQQYKDISADMLHGMEKLENWLDAYAIDKRLEAAKIDPLTSEATNER